METKNYFEINWNLCLEYLNEADFIYEKLGTHHLKFIKFRNFYFVLDKEYCLIGGVEFQNITSDKIELIKVFNKKFSSGFMELISFCILSTEIKSYVINQNYFSNNNLYAIRYLNDRFEISIEDNAIDYFLDEIFRIEHSSTGFSMYKHYDPLLDIRFFGTKVCYDKF